MDYRLEKEIEVFEAHRKELLGRARGKYVLIKDDLVIDFFDSQVDAIKIGYEKFGNQPFLVKQVLEFDSPANFTSNLFAS